MRDLNSISWGLALNFSVLFVGYSHNLIDVFTSFLCRQKGAKNSAHMVAFFKEKVADVFGVSGIK